MPAAVVVSFPARGSRDGVCGVRPENEAARRLYEGFGFDRAGRYQDSRGPWDVMMLESGAGQSNRR